MELGDFLARPEEVYYFKHGATSAYWHLASVLSQHLDGGKE